MMNQRLIGLSVIILLLSYSLAKAQEPARPQTEVLDLMDGIDSLFSPAANSSDYLIIRDVDLENLKAEISNTFLEKSQSQNTAYVSSAEPVNLTPANVVSSSFSAEEKSQNYNFLWILATIVLFAVCLILVYLNSKNRLQMIDSIDRLKTLEGDFEQHKKASVDRERKLMRDLIDARSMEG